MIEWGVAKQPRSSQQESGDLHVIQALADGFLVGVIDGLGHGPEAAAASRLCGAQLAEHAGAPLTEIVTRCHRRLYGTRGATLTLAAFNSKKSTWSWLGVGNVVGVLVRAGRSSRPDREFLVLRNGLVGARLPRLWVATVPAVPGDTMILATDGIRNDFSEALNLTGTPQQIAEHTLAQHAMGTDDALVLVTRYSEAEREQHQT